MRHKFEAESWFPFPLVQVFGFFSNPENLPPIMPAWQKSHIESAKLTTPEDAPHVPHTVAGAGSELYITFRPIPFIPMRTAWRALISDYVYPSHFCDQQLSGPFKYWRHCHRFHREERDGIEGTLVRDELVYELPLALVSDALNPFVRINIAAVFRYRQTETLRLLSEQHTS